MAVQFSGYLSGGIKISTNNKSGQRRGASRTKTRIQTGNIPPSFKTAVRRSFYLKNRRNQNEQAGNIHFKYHEGQGQTSDGYCYSYWRIRKYSSLLYPQTPAGGCSAELLPKLRKAGDTNGRQKSKTVLLGSVPKCVVERALRGYQQESLLSFYLRLLRKGV